MTAVSMHNVTVRRANNIILKVPYLELPQGRLIGLLGPNGAGKSTLLSLCGARMSPTTGSVHLLGANIRSAAFWSRTRLRCRIGWVEQSPDISPDVPLTVREVIQTGRVGRCGLLRRMGRHDYAVVDDWITRLSLRSIAARTFRTLSGGEQRKVLIARAMVQEPELLLLDEPAANLDLDWRARLVALIDRLYRETRLTVVVVAHDLSLLPPSCDTVGLLRRGQILFLGPRAEALLPQRLSSLYNCPVKVVRAAGRTLAVADAFAREEA